MGQVFKERIQIGHQNLAADQPAVLCACTPYPEAVGHVLSTGKIVVFRRVTGVQTNGFAVR